MCFLPPKKGKEKKSVLYSGVLPLHGNLEKSPEVFVVRWTAISLPFCTWAWMHNYHHWPSHNPLIYPFSGPCVTSFMCFMYLPGIPGRSSTRWFSSHLFSVLQNLLKYFPVIPFCASILLLPKSTGIKKTRTYAYTHFWSWIWNPLCYLNSY